MLSPGECASPLTESDCLSCYGTIIINMASAMINIQIMSIFYSQYVTRIEWE